MRHAKVTDQRTCTDFAECMRDLVDVHYPGADRIRLVLDNPHAFGLSTRHGGDRDGCGLPDAGAQVTLASSLLLLPAISLGSRCLR